MTVIVESKRMKVTQALRQFVEQQTQKIVKLSKPATMVRVNLETVEKKSNDPLANSVTFRVQTPGKDVVVTKRAVDMYDAIVDASKGAARQLRKYYERQLGSKRLRRHDISGDMLPTAY